MGSRLCFASDWLNDLSQVTSLLWASVSPSGKGRHRGPSSSDGFWFSGLTSAAFVSTIHVINSVKPFIPTAQRSPWLQSQGPSYPKAISKWHGTLLNPPNQRLSEEVCMSKQHPPSSALKAGHVWGYLLSINQVPATGAVLVRRPCPALSELTGLSITTSYRPLALFQRGSRIQYFFLIRLSSLRLIILLFTFYSWENVSLEKWHTLLQVSGQTVVKTRVPALVSYTPRGTCDLSVVVSFTV